MPRVPVAVDVAPERGDAVDVAAAVACRSGRCPRRARSRAAPPRTSPLLGERMPEVGVVEGLDRVRHRSAASLRPAPAETAASARLPLAERSHLGAVAAVGHVAPGPRTVARAVVEGPLAVVGGADLHPLPLVGEDRLADDGSDPRHRGVDAPLRSAPARRCTGRRSGRPGLPPRPPRSTARTSWRAARRRCSRAGPGAAPRGARRRDRGRPDRAWRRAVPRSCSASQSLNALGEDELLLAGLGVVGIDEPADDLELAGGVAVAVVAHVHTL